MIRGLVLGLVEKVLMGIVYVIFGSLGVALGLLSCLPMLVVSLAGGVAYAVDLLSHTGLRAHERLHTLSARVVGVPVTDAGWRDVDGANHVAYFVQADISGISQAFLVAYAPLLLSLVAVLSFALARVFDSLLLLVLLVPFILSSTRYSLPSDSDARVVLCHSRSDLLHPLNLLAVPVSILFVLLGSPRHVHYRLLHLSELCWGFLLFSISSPVARFLSSFPRGVPIGTVGERLLAKISYLAETAVSCL